MVPSPSESAVGAPAASGPLAPNGWPNALLRGFRQGRPEALGEVYRRHADEVARQLRYGFSFSTAGRMHRFVGYQSAFEFQDALHETFRRAFEPGARERYDGIRPEGPYLRTIARNVVLRGFRRREEQFPEVRSDGGSGPEPVEFADEDAPSPELSVGRQQVQRLVQRFLKEELDEAERQLLTLRFVEGKSQRDAAEALGLGRQQVRGRETKLRQRLVRFLRAHGEDELMATSLWLPMVGLEFARAVGEVLQ